MTFLEVYLIGLGAVLGLMALLWVVSLVLRDSSIVDPFWGTSLVVANWLYFALTPDGFPARKWLISILVTVWGLRLSIQLLRRNWGKGEDFCYRKWREEAGSRWTLMLLRVSGVALLEKTVTTTKPGYREYVESTSALVPWFPREAKQKS